VEYIDPDGRRLQGLLRINRMLTIVFTLIFLALLIFIILASLQATQVMAKTSTSKNVIDIIKVFTANFFDNFGTLTYRYMFFVSMILFANMMFIAINLGTKVFKKRIVYHLFFFGTVILAFFIPIDDYYSRSIRDERTAIIFFCLLMIILAPYLISLCLGRDHIHRMIYSKTLYIIIYGLLVIQIAMEGTWAG